MPLPRSLERAGHVIFGRLPTPVRRAAVGLGTPDFTVGAVCLFEHGDEVLLLRQLHRADWSLPGGLLGRGESSREAVVREVHEELGLRVEVGLPLVTAVDAEVRRVDVVYAVPLEQRIEVSPRREAVRAEWMRPEQLDRERDRLTLRLLGLVAASRRPGAQAGRVLDAR
ncbi:MAG: NUDIX domain-containing protein [Motilibacteraceae bacterium]